MNERVDIIMKVNTIKHFITDAFKSLMRNKTLSFASMTTVATTLFIFGVFLLAVFNINVTMDELGSQFEVKVFMYDDITVDQKSELEKAIGELEGIEEVREETKEEALEIYIEQVGEEYRNVFEDFKNNNPFPSSFIIKVEDPSYVEGVVKGLDGYEGVETIATAKDLVEKVMSVSNTVKWIGLVVFGLFFFVSLFLIVNTIKLTLFSRKREIGIMKYVGATDWFIRWPFIFEGIIIGVVGSLLASGLLYYLYDILVGMIAKDATTTILIQSSVVFSRIMWQFLLGGVIIGCFGSIISIRKFLKV